MEEKRKYPRLKASFVVSYKLFDESKIMDVSQTKNISLGGMLLTTNREFEPGTKLSLTIRLPFQARPLSFIGKVISSEQVVKDMIYDTRIELLSTSEEDRQLFKDTLDIYFKRGEKR